MYDFCNAQFFAQLNAIKDFCNRNILPEYEKGKINGNKRYQP